MASLQKKFNYMGKNNLSPKTINLSFRCPVFTYKLQDSEKRIIREVVSTKNINVSVDAQAVAYEMEIPTTNFTGTDPDIMGKFIRYTSQALIQNDLKAISVSIPSYYFTPDNVLLGDDQIEALYWIKTKSFEMTGRNYMSINSNVEETNPWNNSIFLINKTVYLNELKNLKSISQSDNDFYLLFIIQTCVSVVDGKPTINTKLDSPAMSMLVENLASMGVHDPKKIVDRSMKIVESFFDFPISVPALKSIDVGGDFVLVPSDKSAVDKETLFFYDLSLEYTRTVPNAPALFEILHYDWNMNLKNYAGNKIDFSFSKPIPVISNNITGPLTIKVKGYDSTIVWSRDFEANDAGLSKIKIEVPVLRPNTLTSLDKTATSGDGKKLRGQLLELTKKCPLKDVTVIIQAKKNAGDKVSKIVGAAHTDNSGNFSIPYPFGDYTEAQALVSLAPDKPADIPVDATRLNETIADDFLYLLVAEPICEEILEVEDCDCNSLKKAGRLPDQKDLIASDEYSQDIGGACINLSTPNRTLNEYAYQAIVRTSDPDIANYTLVKGETPPDPSKPGTPRKITFELTGGTTKITRGLVDLNNPIRWQDAPDFHENLSVYQSVTVATGHILHYKTIFKADGYSMGNLLYSLPLAPGQKKQIVIFDSSHSLTGSETQSLSQVERLAAGITNEREIIDQIGGGISEALAGKSSASTAGISAGLGVGVSAGAIGGSLGIAGGYANSNSSASQNSSRNITQFFSEKLRQSITQNADSYRQLNASVVTTVQEGQRYSAETEVVSNHNHCHSLTMMYFEVLRHYAIYQELAEVEECIFVPLLMTNFSTENIFKWSDVLAANLLPLTSSTYLQPFGAIRIGRQHPLLKAFDANERIKTNYAEVDFPTGAYDEEKISFLKGEINLRVNLARPKTRYDRIKSLPVTLKTVSHEEFDPQEGAKSAFLAFLTMGATKIDTTKTVKEQVQANANIFDAFMRLDANYESVPPAQCIRIINFRPPSSLTSIISTIVFNSGVSVDFFENDIIDKKRWTVYASLLGYTDVLTMMENYFLGRLISEWDDIFNNEIAPVLFDKIVDTLALQYISLDTTGISRYNGGERSMRININGFTAFSRKQFPLSIKLFSSSANVNSLKNLVTLTVENVRLLYSTPHYNGVLFNSYVGDDLLDGTDLFIPENADERKNPRIEDIYLVNKLIEHLNSNLEYYNKILWFNLDIDRRYLLLDGFNIQTFNEFGIPAGTRSLASVVKNELVEIVGNSLVFPVSSGYKISQSYIVAKNQQGNLENITLFDHYKPVTPMQPYRVSIPSKGVFMEAVQGACDACEKVKSNTSQDWTKFTTDEPTSISPITTPVPTITDWKAAFKDFAPPIVNIQNAPATPVPGIGLAGLSELLGKSDAFRDITGLAKNQDNVIRTYLSNQENAKAFAEMAKGLAMQDHNTKNSDKIMDSLKSAKDSDAISKDDFSKLTKDHLQQQIDGGESKKQELKKDPKQSLSGAAVKAAEEGKEVKAQKTDFDGSVETVEIKPALVSASVVSGLNAAQVKQDMIRVAKQEEAKWTKNVIVNGQPTDVKLDEADPAVLPYLKAYYNAVFDNGIDPDAARHATAAANNDITSEWYQWSAPFICFVMKGANVNRSNGFEFAPRHLNYIVGAMRNRENSDKSRPFWLYSSEEALSAEANPQPGDILCLNQTGHNDTYASLRSAFFGTNNPVYGHGHCDIVVDIVEETVNAIPKTKVLRTIGGNVSGTVGFKKYLLDKNGIIEKVFDAGTGTYGPLGANLIIGVIKIIDVPVKIIDVPDIITV